MRKTIEDDHVEALRQGLRSVANAITADAAPGHDEVGGCVSSLTEAVMGMTKALVGIGDAISDLAEAVRESGGIELS